MKFRWWLAIALGLFVTGLVLGLLIPVGTGNVLSEEMAVLEELAGILEPFTAGMAVFIFFKNVSALLLSFAFSPLLCLMPALALLINGGLISALSVSIAREISAGLVLAALLPHGVFEIPALIIGEAAALSFGFMAILALFSSERRKQFFPGARQPLKYLAIACGLLVPAAIIETFVTPLLLP